MFPVVADVKKGNLHMCTNTETTFDTARITVASSRSPSYAHPGSLQLMHRHKTDHKAVSICLLVVTATVIMGNKNYNWYCSSHLIACKYHHTLLNSEQTILS